MPMLLPPDLREWVPEDDLVHFVIEAVDDIPLGVFHLNLRGTGSQQYNPRMMLALLIYCYANGIFSSRRIERATYRDVAVRYLTADTHPDHDTICTFRRRNERAVSEAFLHVLKLAGETGLLKVGTVSVDGTQIEANASKSKNVRYDRAEQLERKLQRDIKRLMQQAEEADNSDRDDGQKLPDAIARREQLREKMKQAKANLKKRAQQRNAAERAKYEQRLDEYQARKNSGQSGLRPPQKPRPKGPRPTEQSNLTDEDSRLMRKNPRAEFRQAYNAQTAVDADGSQLILSRHVTNCASDAAELEPALAGIDASIGTPHTALADKGYCSGDVIERLEHSDIDLYVSVGAEADANCRRYDFRPSQKKEKQTYSDKRLLSMQQKMKTDEARGRYAKRKQTVEPVFGIIKSAMGFRQFLLRGLEKVSLEWSLVCLAYNMKHLHALSGATRG